MATNGLTDHGLVNGRTDDRLGRTGLIDGGDAVEVELDGKVCRFHAMWLRDNAQDAETRSLTNGQRRITLRDIPADTRITDARWTGDRLDIRFEPEGRVIGYGTGWLRAHSYDKPARSEVGWTDIEITRWDGGQATAIPLVAYDDLRNDDGMRLSWLNAIQRYGVARISGIPGSDQVPLSIAALFGYIRETNYGRVFDVRVEANPNNLAYTNLGLQAHTDNPYRDPTPGLQILACLSNEVDGGDSVVVDGFEVAQRLMAEWPRGFALLSSHAARFEYAGAPGVRLRSKKPIIELGPDGELLAIRFNNRSAAPIVDVPYDEMGDYYRAYRLMAELIDDPGLAVCFKLAPGDAFVVDNLRVLHARRAITSGGNRHLQGCYVDRDGLRSTIAALERKQETQ